MASISASSFNLRRKPAWDNEGASGLCFVSDWNNDRKTRVGIFVSSDFYDAFRLSGSKEIDLPKKMGFAMYLSLKAQGKI